MFIEAIYSRIEIHYRRRRTCKCISNNKVRNNYTKKYCLNIHIINTIINI